MAYSVTHGRNQRRQVFLRSFRVERQEPGESPRGKFRLRAARRGGDDFSGFCGELDPQKFSMADDVWLGLLCDRDDVDGRRAFRYRALWRGSFSPIAAAVRPDHHCWTRVAEES